MTKIIKCSSEAISEAAFALMRGGIVILPTNRWYMICSKAENQEAIERIFGAKKRELARQPLFVLPDKNSIHSYFKITHEIENLVKNLWPGELSLLLLWSNQKVSAQFRYLDQSYALTNNPPGFFGELAKTVGIPLAATSVNVSALPADNKYGPAINLDEVTRFVQESGINIDIIIDGGISPAFNHTTIIDCRNLYQKPTLIRDGYVHKRALNAALGYELFN